MCICKKGTDEPEMEEGRAGVKEDRMGCRRQTEAWDAEDRGLGCRRQRPGMQKTDRGLGCRRQTEAWDAEDRGLGTGLLVKRNDLQSIVAWRQTHSSFLRRSSH
jgi:hypothetical protein